MTQQRNRKPGKIPIVEVSHTALDTSVRRLIAYRQTPAHPEGFDFPDSMDEDELWATIYAEERNSNPVLRLFQITMNGA